MFKVMDMPKTNKLSNNEVPKIVTLYNYQSDITYIENEPNDSSLNIRCTVEPH